MVILGFKCFFEISKKIFSKGYFRISVSSTTRDSKGSRLVWGRGELPVRRNKETSKFSGIYSLSNSAQINTIKTILLTLLTNKLTD